ncbi:hypothetical protein [Ferruginibacter sp.]
MASSLPEFILSNEGLGSSAYHWGALIMFCWKEGDGQKIETTF